MVAIVHQCLKLWIVTKYNSRVVNYYRTLHIHLCKWREKSMELTLGPSRTRRCQAGTGCRPVAAGTIVPGRGGRWRCGAGTSSGAASSVYVTDSLAVHPFFFCPWPQTPSTIVGRPPTFLGTASHTLRWLPVPALPETYRLHFVAADGDGANASN